MATDADKETAQLNLTVPKALKDRLSAAADERMIASSVLGIRAIEDFLDALVPVSELALTRERGGPGGTAKPPAAPPAPTPPT